MNYTDPEKKNGVTSIQNIERCNSMVYLIDFVIYCFKLKLQKMRSIYKSDTMLHVNGL